MSFKENAIIDGPSLAFQEQNTFTDTLRSQKKLAYRNEKRSGINVGRTLMETAEFLPVEYLIKHRMFEYVKQRGLNQLQHSLIEVAKKILLKGFRKWFNIISREIFEERKAASRIIIRTMRRWVIFTSKLKRDKLLEIEKKKRQEEAQVAAYKLKCTILIQSFVRMIISRSKYMKTLPVAKSAVLQIQIQYKWHLRRKKGGILFYDAVLLGQRYISAVRFVQRVYRGFIGRLRRYLRRTVTNRVTLQKRYESRPELMNYYFEQHGAALKLQRWAYKMKWPQKVLERKRLVLKAKYMNARALIIQRCYRGHRGRAIARQVMAEHKLRLWIKRQHQSATKIQARFRGCRSRVQMAPELQLRRSPEYRARKYFRTKVLRMINRSLQAAHSYMLNPVMDNRPTGFRARRSVISFNTFVIGDVKRIQTLGVYAGLVQRVWRGHRARKLAAHMKAQVRDRAARLILHWFINRRWKFQVE